MKTTLTLEDLTPAEVSAVYDALQNIKSGVHTKKEVAPPAESLFEDAPIPGTEDATTDDHGVPWHADFHATSKAKTADGSWRLKKNANKEAAAAYARGFQQLGSNTGAVINAAPVAPAQMAGLHTPSQLPMQQTGFGDVFGAPVIPIPTVDEVRTRYEGLVRSGKIPADYFITLCKNIGIAGADQLQHDADARRRAMVDLNRVAA